MQLIAQIFKNVFYSYSMRSIEMHWCFRFPLYLFAFPCNFLHLFLRNFRINLSYFMFAIVSLCIFEQA